MHELGGDRSEASGNPPVLVERAGTFLDRLVEKPEVGRRVAWYGLGLAITAYTILALWLMRGASFTNEEFIYVGESDGFSPGSLLDPFGGHLTATTRVIYEGFLRLFGPSYLPFELVVVAMVATVSLLLFVIALPRVGSLPALAVAIIFLFLGSTPEVLQGWTTMWVQSAAAGLGGLVALERRSRTADLVACVLLVMSVLAFSIGVAFAIGAAAWIAAERSWRRIWIAVIPLLAYFAWWAWALKFNEGFQTLSNVLLVPSWAADSAAAAAASLSGLGVDMTQAPNPLFIGLGWGRLLAVGILVLVIIGVRRRGVSPLLWASVAFLAALWFGEGLSFSADAFTKRTPDLDRYAYPVAIGLVLALLGSWSGWRPSKAALAILIGLLALAFPANLWLMNERGSATRKESDLARASATAMELTRNIVDPGYKAIQSGGGVIPYPASSYLAAVDRFGSFGFSTSEIAAASPETRRVADETLGAIVSPSLAEVKDRGLHCSRYLPQAPLPAGGAAIRSDGGGTVVLRRFADKPYVDVGTLAPEQAGRIELPADSSERPWIVSVSGGRVAVCSAG